jgi:uncharacterized cupin superfamily protein
MAMPYRVSRRAVLQSAGIAIVSAQPAVADGVPTVPQTPHGPLSSFIWEALPEFGGSQAIIYRSPDGRRVAAAFQESGSFTFTYPFDEFLIVTSGSAKFRIEGGASFELKTGDVAYLREGTVAHIELSDDFSDITMLIADHPVRWR